MTAHTLQTASLICLERSPRSGLMREMDAVAPEAHGTEFRLGMHADATPVEENLEKGRVRLLPARDLMVLCLAGELWITRDGDAEDYILGPGQRLTIGRNDQAAVQALRTSRFRLTPT